MMRLFLARHGQTELNRTKVYYGKLDVPIDDVGAEQCRNLSRCLAAVNFDAVIASDLQRAVESAKMIIGDVGNSLKIERYETLSEIDFGLWEGLHHSEISGRYPEEWKAWAEDWMGYRFPQGESFEIFYDRVKDAFDRIRREYKDQTILVVAHEGTLRAIATMLLKLPADACWSFHFEYGTYSMFEVEEQIAVVQRINCQDVWHDKK